MNSEGYTDIEIVGMSDELRAFLEEWNSPSTSVLVHTSGSTGAPKPMLVEKSRMMASARLTCDFLHLRPGDTALLCMPLKYIAGKMVVVRALCRGLRLLAVSPSGHPLAGLSEIPTFAAMVPLQVYNSVKVEAELQMLRQIPHLIIGGGAIDASLEQQLRTFPNAVWATYGMTETLSHIAMRRISGEHASDCYTPMEGVRVFLSSRGTLCIDAPRVCAEVLETNDVAEIQTDGTFRILGRIDNVVCSGGVKIQIEEVERALNASFLARYGRKPGVGERMQMSFAPDEKFGQRLVMLMEGEETAESLWQECFDDVSPYWAPKSIVRVAELRLTETGKPDRGWARRVAQCRNED